MGKAIAIKSGIMKRQTLEKISPQLETGEIKLKTEMKILRQQITRTSNEIY